MDTTNFHQQIFTPYVPPTTKENHLIPQFLLRNFCKTPVKESIYLNTLTNKKSHAKIKNGKIIFKNKFSQKFIFNNTLETNLGILETKSAPLIKRLHDFSHSKLKCDFSGLNGSSINCIVTDINFFKYTKEDKKDIANLYISIFIRLLMNSTMNKTNLITAENLLNTVSSNVYKQLFSNNTEDTIKVINSLNNFKRNLQNTDSEHFIQLFNEFYFFNSNAKEKVFDFIYNSFLQSKVVLVTWDCAILPIANSLPFSWQNKVMYLPVSANSILYIDDSIDRLSYNYIQSNSFQIIKEYRLHIENNAYEFLYYDTSMAQLRNDYSIFKY